MAGDRGGSFPIAALGVVALFLSASFLGQHAFDLLRVGENDAAKRLQLSQPPVEARLWEDPFAALLRHRSKLKELCTDLVGSSGARRPDPRCARGEQTAGEFRDEFKDDRHLTMIAVMLPGAAFIGVEEARRRMRYALLSGLNAEGFDPDDSEHMGLLRVPPCARFAGCEVPVSPPDDNAPLTAATPPPKMDILYETLSEQRDAKGKGREQGAPDGAARARRRVVVLWIDDTAIAPRWLSALTVLLTDITRVGGARHRIIGPYKSDDLVRALVDDLPALAVESQEAGETEPFQKNARTLARLHLISPFSTAAAAQLRQSTARLSDLPECREDAAGKDCVAEAFKTRLASIVAPAAEAPESEPKPEPFFVRTIGTDDRLIKLLAQELCARGLADHASGRVVLLSEWDSIYARSFAQALNDRLQCAAGNRFAAENYTYLRGLDGANLDGPSKQVRLVPRGADKSKDDKTPSIEWPESRDQRDYVRRLVGRMQQEIKWGRPESGVLAIGMIGTDVHDKLVLAQALRAAFPDRTLFTTDLDVRLMHPEVSQYTRNLIVASSLPLALDDEYLRAPVAPFRDIYQTATFLAARYAVLTGEKAQEFRSHVTAQKPLLYEIGRNGEVELGIDDVPDAGARRIYAWLVGAVLLVLGGFMLFGNPAPAMRAALGRPRAPLAMVDLSTAVLSGLQVAAWGFALCVAFELGDPGAVGPRRAVLFALLLMLVFWAFVYPGVGNFGPGQASAGLDAARAWRRRQLLARSVGLTVLFAAILVLPWARPYAGEAELARMREPFDLFNGVSAWPSELLRVLAVVLFAWFLDFAWSRGDSAAREIGDDYFPSDSPLPVRPPVATLRERLTLAGDRVRLWLMRWYRLLRRNRRRFVRVRRMQTVRALSAASVWFWQPRVRRVDGGLHGAQLWRDYRNLMRNGPRTLRILLWVALGVGFVVLESFLMGGALPEIPARGFDDRALFSFTILVHLLAVVILLVLVGDVTILTWCFIGILKKGRTIYPDKTVQRFAAELGPDPELQKEVAARIAPRVVDRANAGAARWNSLLDDWIDARLLARHTEAIGSLILYPFVLVGLLVVARSRALDNWAIDGAVLVALVTYLLWAIAMAALLNFSAEVARRKAVESMQKDLLWLEGTGADYQALTKRFPALIGQVQNLRRGAFAPFYEQPLVQAILVPLGGAGGYQLVEMFMFARS